MQKNFDREKVLTGSFFLLLSIIMLFFIINGIPIKHNEHLTILLPIALALGVIIFYLCTNKREVRQIGADTNIYSIAIIYASIIIYGVIFENKIIYGYKLHHFFWIGLLLLIVSFNWPFSVFQLFKKQLPRPLILFFLLSTISLFFSPTEFTKDFMHLSLQLVGWIVLYQCISINHAYKQIDLVFSTITLLFWFVLALGLIIQISGFIGFFSSLKFHDMLYFGSTRFCYEGVSGQYFRLWAAWTLIIHLSKIRKKNIKLFFFHTTGAFLALYIFLVAYGRTSFIAVIIGIFSVVTIFIYYKKNFFTALIFSLLVLGVSSEIIIPTIQSRVLRMHEDSWDSYHLDIWKQHHMILKDYYITGGGWALKKTVLRGYLPAGNGRINDLLSVRGTLGEGAITGLYARRGIFVASLLIMFSVMTIFEWVRINKKNNHSGEQTRNFVLVFIGVSYMVSLISQGTLLSVTAPNDFIFSYIIIAMWSLKPRVKKTQSYLTK